jgi:penicillin-binding protein 2
MTPHEQRYCPGHFRLPGQTHRYRDWRPQGHGNVAMHEAIVQSCDVYFYHLAVAMGIDAMAEGLKQFGFGAPVGLDIRGENAGVVPSRDWKAKQFTRREDKVWFPGETVITGIGQGYMLVTPVQLAHAGATFAARGERFVPRLLIGTEDPLTREVQYAEPRRLSNVADHDPQHWQIVHDAMLGVTAEPRGSARAPMQGTTYSVAGKTGTAQVIGIAQDEKYREEDIDERLRDHGLFVAFAPADAPRIALGVVVENGGGGSRAAAPVARKIFDAYFAAENYVARDP